MPARLWLLVLRGLIRRIVDGPYSSMLARWYVGNEVGRTAMVLCEAWWLPVSRPEGNCILSKVRAVGLSRAKDG